jgi:hypothetical protein
LGPAFPSCPPSSLVSGCHRRLCHRGGRLYLVDGSSSAATVTGIAKIKHVVVIMQENRSFDTYFGTYPGADGIP